MITQRSISLLLILMFFSGIVAAQRTFIHPGISYTQSDLDRMKAMVAAKQEPFYATYVKMKADAFSARGGRVGLTRINEGQFNGIIGADGRGALQQALIWKIEGDATYANRAVEILNSYKNLVSASCRGTGPLDNGKIYMLLDAAELMRDYSGWVAADQLAFKSMLVHPGYSTKALPSSHYNLDDALNDVTFYWNIFNGDSGRHGNQGLFAFRGLMAMGIFLDNDTIYDRAFRKYMSLPHRSDDLAYPSGPPVINYTMGTYATYEEYNLGSRQNTTSDYGYDDELKYYIYENGQCQESFRDQAHTMGGITNCFDLAKMAWNQGDNLFDAYNGRILKGLEWNTRFNVGYKYANRWPNEGLYNPTVANGQFLSRLTRCMRWKGLAIATGDRGAECSERVRMLMQYKVRMGMPADSIKWIQRAYDVMMDSVGYEIGYVAPSWYYEQNGWGHLLSFRTAWMAGDGVTFIDGKRSFGIHPVPGSFKAVDYDYYPALGEGHTYHNVELNINNSNGSNSLPWPDPDTSVDLKLNSTYRGDGTIEISSDTNGYFVDAMQAGEWMNYTISVPVTRDYYVYVTCNSIAATGQLSASYDAADTITASIPITSGFSECRLGRLTLRKGAGVLRIMVGGVSNVLRISSIRIEETEESLELKGVDLALYRKGTYNQEVGSVLSGVPANLTDGIFTNSIGLGSQKLLVYDFGKNVTISQCKAYTLLNGDGSYEGANMIAISTENQGFFGPRTTIFRSNGTSQGGVPVLNNSLSINGSQTVGPFTGRYLYVNNWSRTCTFTELELTLESPISTNMDFTSVASGSGKWSDGKMWTKGVVPSNGANVVVNAKLENDQNTSVVNLVVNPGAKLINNARAMLTISDIVLKSDSTGTGTFFDNGSTNAASVCMQQYLRGSATGGIPDGRFCYLTSPVAGANSAVFDAAGANKLWAFTEGASSSTLAYTEITNNTTALTPGSGYVARLTGNTLANFNGTSFVNGDVSINLGYTIGSPKAGFNLIGNPYPSYLNINAALKTANAVETWIEPTIWYRSYNSSNRNMVFDTHNTTSGEKLVLSGNELMHDSIPPMQGFWVRANKAGVLTLKNSMRSATPRTLLRNAEILSPKLRLEVSNGACSDDALIAFYADGADSIDRYDSHKMFNGVANLPEVYSLVSGHELAINGLARLDEIENVQLGFKTALAGRFTLKATECLNFESDRTIVLEDRLKNIQWNLTDSPVYEFESDATTTIDRFSLVFGKTSTGLGGQPELLFDVLDNRGYLSILLHNLIKEQVCISVLDLMGREVISASATCSMFTLNRKLGSGIYMVKVRSSLSEKMMKVVVPF